MGIIPLPRHYVRSTLKGKKSHHFKASKNFVVHFLILFIYACLFIPCIYILFISIPFIPCFYILFTPIPFIPCFYILFIPFPLPLYLLHFIYYILHYFYLSSFSPLKTSNKKDFLPIFPKWVLNLVFTQYG